MGTTAGEVDIVIFREYMGSLLLCGLFCDCGGECDGTKCMKQSCEHREHRLGGSKIAYTGGDKATAFCDFYLWIFLNISFDLEDAQDMSSGRDGDEEDCTLDDG